jgi:hypothetical protein
MVRPWFQVSNSMPSKLHPRDSLNGGSVKEIAQGTIGSLKMRDRIHHGLVLLGFPVAGFELLICNVLNSKLIKNIPTDSVTRNRERRPLSDRREEKKNRERK